MPIRFRCVYCDKLLGIARRKAGAIVGCPHCGEKLIVPTPEPESESAAADHDPLVDEASPPQESEEDNELLAAAGLFERSDFEALLQPQPTMRAPDESPPAPKKPLRPKQSSPPPQLDAPALFPALPGAGLPQYTAPPPKPAPPPPGFYISPTKATWLGVLFVILLAIAFAGGLMVGRFFRPS